tara:strand:+ start:12779 stop:13147 length:369 start_codon:yes stop_codon:yes gene_type:complete
MMARRNRIYVTIHAARRIEERLGVYGSIQHLSITKRVWSYGPQTGNHKPQEHPGQHIRLHLDHKWVFKLKGERIATLITVVPLEDLEERYEKTQKIKDKRYKKKREKMDKKIEEDKRNKYAK